MKVNQEISGPTRLGSLTRETVVINRVPIRLLVRLDSGKVGLTSLTLLEKRETRVLLPVLLRVPIFGFEKLVSTEV